MKVTILSITLLASVFAGACGSNKTANGGGGSPAGGGGRGGGPVASGGSGPGGGLGGTAAGGSGAGGMPNGGSGPGGTAGGGAGGAGGAAGGNLGGGGVISADCAPQFRNGGTFAGPISGNGQLLLADLNADGKPELISVDNAGIAVFSNDGTGHFTPHGSYVVTSMTTFAAATGDLNGDGFVDIVFASDVGPTPNGPPHLGVFLNKGDGTFSPQVSYALPFAGAGVAIGDLDGDHQVDVAVSAGTSVYVLTNLGNGQLAAPVQVDAGTSLLSIVLAGPIALADLDGDGKLDLLVEQFDAVGAWINKGGLVVSPASVGLGGGAFEIHLDAFVTTDLNGDRSPDLVTVGALGMVQHGEAAEFLNDGHGNFASSPLNLGSPRYEIDPLRVVAGDFDGDGRMDLAVVETVTTTVGAITTFMARVDGTFQSASCPTMVLARAGFVAGDLNGDGLADLAFHTDSGITLQLSIAP